MNYVFRGGRLITQYDPPTVVHQTKVLPMHSWVYNSEQGSWYYMESPRLSTYVATDEVPKDIRALALLLT